MPSIQQPIAIGPAARPGLANKVVVLPLVFLAIALAEFALKWWPAQELASVVSGRPERYWHDYRTPALAYYGSPVSLATLLAALVLVFAMFRRWQPLRRLAPPSSFAWLALIVFVLAQALYVVGTRFRLYELGIGWAYAALGVLFKLLAAHAAYLAVDGPRRTSTAWASTVSLQDEGARPTQSFRTTVAVAVALYPVLPVWESLLQVAQGFSWPFIAALWRPATGYGELVAFACKAGLQLLLARLMLRTCCQKGLLRVARDHWAAKASYRLLVLYGVLLPVVIVLSAIPYGGGYVPAEMRLLISAAQLLGLLCLFFMLPRPPAADGRPDEP